MASIWHIVCCTQERILPFPSPHAYSQAHAHFIHYYPRVGFDKLIKVHFVFFIGGCAWMPRARFVHHISVTTLEATDPFSNHDDIDCFAAINFYQAFVDVNWL